MCKSQADGGQRCASHTGAIYATKKAEYLSIQDADGAGRITKLAGLNAAATLYATTKKGIVALKEEIEILNNRPVIDLGLTTALEGALLEGQRQRAVTKETERQILRARRDEETRTKEVERAIRISNRDELGKNFATEYGLRPDMEGKSKWTVYKATLNAIDETYNAVVDEQVSLIDARRRNTQGDIEENLTAEEELLHSIFRTPVNQLNEYEAGRTPEVKEARLIQLASKKAARDILVSQGTDSYTDAYEVESVENPEDNIKRIAAIDRALRIRNREENARRFVEAYCNRPENLNKAPWENYKAVISKAEFEFDNVVTDETEAYLNDNPAINRHNGFDEDMIREGVLEVSEVKEANRVFLATRKVARGLLLAETNVLTPEEQAEMDQQGIDALAEMDDFA